MPVIACSFNTGWTCRHLLEEGPAVPVTLPHDAALAEPRTETAPGGTNTGWYEGYDYLYEKRFTPDAALQGQTLVLEFEGVYHNAEVWLNGEKLAFNPYGYTDFKVDLTGKLDFDAENVLQVIARNADQPNSRWYSGAGIYRPVTLVGGPGSTPAAGRPAGAHRVHRPAGSGSHGGGQRPRHRAAAGAGRHYRVGQCVR